MQRKCDPQTVDLVLTVKHKQIRSHRAAVTLEVNTSGTAANINFRWS